MQDDVQQANLEFFMHVGIGLHSVLPSPAATNFVIVVSGDTCSPCQMVLPQMRPAPAEQLPPHVKGAWTDQASKACHSCSLAGLHVYLQLHSRQYMMQREF